MRLSPNEIAYVAQAAGFTGDDLVTAVAVFLAESGGDTEAMGRSKDPTSPNVGNWDHGLAQVSNKWHQRLADGTPGRLLKAGAAWRDPYVNARLAFEIYTAAGSTFTPWAVFKSGSYETYLPDAKIAVKAPWAPPAAAVDELATRLKNATKES